MSLHLCNSAYAILTSSQVPTPPKPKFLCKSAPGGDFPTLRCSEKSAIGVLGAALSLSLLISQPSFAVGVADASPVRIPELETGVVEKCAERETEAEDESFVKAPGVVSNEGVVEEAWRIVNETFLNAAGRRRWSPEAWLEKKQDILGSGIRTRSKAHDVIRKMLAGLGDPYTRFLTPEEFSRISRYDITGIGINIKEVPDDTGGEKLKVLGVILDGPAHAAGVRQVCVCN
uniref:Uncharacterized protein n=1 Tax=Kalanchoe fedtschenkoi TaxID=63787 RepID=A0A7N0SWL5_KALFE